MMLDCDQFLIIDVTTDQEIRVGDRVRHWTDRTLSGIFQGITAAPGPYNIARVVVSSGQDRDAWGYTCTQWRLAVTWREGGCAHLVDWDQI